MEYLNYIVSKVKRLKKDDQTFLIAIDGFGGSGKSTMAHDLARRLDNVSIVHSDDFHLPELNRSDRARISEQVIKPLKANRIARYQRFDWPSSSLAEWHEIYPRGVVILEGVSMLHPDLGNQYDLTIWIDMPQEEAAKRGIDRDLHEYKVDTREQWEKIWIPQEKEYVESVNPKAKADIIVRYV